MQKKVDKSLQNKVFLATEKNLLLLTKTSIQMGSKLRHRQLLVKRTDDKNLSCISSSVGKGYNVIFFPRKLPLCHWSPFISLHLESVI